MCGTSIPEGLHRELHARESSPEAVVDFGVAYATLQCAELLREGAPGHSLLHAQPLAGHARDSGRAEAGAAVAERRLGRVRAGARERSGRVRVAIATTASP